MCEEFLTSLGERGESEISSQVVSTECGTFHISYSSCLDLVGSQPSGWRIYIINQVPIHLKLMQFATAFIIIKFK